MSVVCGLRDLIKFPLIVTKRLFGLSCVHCVAAKNGLMINKYDMICLRIIFAYYIVLPRPDLLDAN